MVANRLLSFALCLVALIFPQALTSQTHLTIESLAMDNHSDTADFTLVLQSKDLDWKAAGNGKSKADLILITRIINKRGDVLVYEREFRTVTADTQDPAKLGFDNSPIPVKVKIPSKTNKVQFFIETANERKIGAAEVDGKTIYAADTSELPRPPCGRHGWC